MTNELFGIAAALHDRGILTFDEVTNIRQDAKSEGLHLNTYLLKNQIISSSELMNICKDYFRIAPANLKEFDASLIHENILHQDLIERHHVIPLTKQNDLLILGMTDPSDHEAVAAIRFHTNLRIQPALISEDDYQRIINTYYRPNILYSQLQNALAKFHNHTDNKTMEMEDEQPVVRFVEQLFTDAVSKGISDIHIQNDAKHARIRFRLDGLLHDAAELPIDFATRIITRIKIMAKMDIAEKRLPQDGRFKLDLHAAIDARASTCPNLHGEKMVLRLLRHQQHGLSISELGMLPEQLTLFQDCLAKPQGLIIVTGPTGSGKSATLYAALNHLNTAQKNILTIEDPVEQELTGATQVNINPQIGLTFPHALRAFMRQDPDIIMIGEIRDRETAETAIHAAQTGHMVLTTLHTNSASDTIKRLLGMGIPSYLIGETLNLIVAQRLLRTYCQHCHGNTDSDCTYCHDGYLGRTGIFELLAVNPAQVLEKLQVTTDLYTAGKIKVKQAITSLNELQRITGKSCHAH